MGTKNPNRHFLVVENDPNDALLIGIAFKSIEPAATWLVCRNTSEGKAYLNGAGMYADRKKYPLPAAVLTDFRMAGETGADFVTWMRSQAAFREMPVIIMSGCASADEMKAAEKVGAEKVVRKPGRLEELKELIGKIVQEVCAGTSSD